jgi:hypothetical protein
MRRQALPNKNLYETKSINVYTITSTSKSEIILPVLQAVGHYLRFNTFKSVSEFPSLTHATTEGHYTMDTNFPVHLQNQTGPHFAILAPFYFWIRLALVRLCKYIYSLSLYKWKQIPNGLIQSHFPVRQLQQHGTIVSHSLGFHLLQILYLLLQKQTRYYKTDGTNNITLHSHTQFLAFR